MVWSLQPIIIIRPRGSCHRVCEFARAEEAWSRPRLISLGNYCTSTAAAVVWDAAAPVSSVAPSAETDPCLSCCIWTFCAAASVAPKRRKNHLQHHGDDLWVIIFHIECTLQEIKYIRRWGTWNDNYEKKKEILWTIITEHKMRMESKHWICYS